VSVGNMIVAGGMSPIGKISDDWPVAAWCLKERRTIEMWLLQISKAAGTCSEGDITCV